MERLEDRLIESGKVEEQKREKMGKRIKNTKKMKNRRSKRKRIKRAKKRSREEKEVEKQVPMQSHISYSLTWSEKGCHGKLTAIKRTFDERTQINGAEIKSEKIRCRGM